MKFQARFPRLALLPQGLRGMFNLNDPRWGRGDDAKGGDGNADQEQPARPPYVPPPESNNLPQQRPNSNGSPDLDELWQDLNKKLSGLFGGSGGGAGRVCCAAQRHLRGVPAAQALAPESAAVDRLPQAAIRTARVLGGAVMPLRVPLHVPHFPTQAARAVAD